MRRYVMTLGVVGLMLADVGRAQTDEVFKEAAKSPATITQVPTKAASEMLDQDANQWLQEGFALLGQSKTKEARDLLQKVLAKHPQHGRARLGLATAHVEMKNWKEAKAIFETLLKDYPDDAIVMNNYAWMLATTDDMSVRDAKKAMRLAQEARRTRPTDFRVLSTLAESYFVDGQYDVAANLAQAAGLLAAKAGASPELIQIYSSQEARCRQSLIAQKQAAMTNAPPTSPPSSP